jgi:protoporphyrinogen IX oxidase
MNDAYLWLKFFHLVALVAWMAGLFYLPRLLVYHAQVSSESDTAQIFQVMERRLYKIIVLPSMIFTLASGAFLATIMNHWTSGWLHLKLTAVLGILIFQFLLNRWRFELANGTCRFGVKFFRIINEIPTILLIIIIFSVVFKPF